MLSQVMVGGSLNRLKEIIQTLKSIKENVKSDILWKDSAMLGMSGNGWGTRGRIEAERGKRALLYTYTYIVQLTVTYSTAPHCTYMYIYICCVCALKPEILQNNHAMFTTYCVWAHSKLGIVNTAYSDILYTALVVAFWLIKCLNFF